VLGTDKRNPVFTVYRAEPAAAASLHVSYGAELLEVVREEGQHPAFKLLIGRLYNAGVKAVTLPRSFGVDRKTMQRWGRALQSEDPQQLVQALTGRGSRKLTPEIRALVTRRFPQIYSQSRAGYSQRVRAEIEAPNDHLITWEKNYRRGQWDPQKRSGQCVLERTRNHAQDLRVYRFEYLDQPWARNPQMRQLLVRATHPQGRTVEVAILTDDRQRPASEIVCLMFNRWIQENDFKDLDQHFGINEITSYASVAYERLQDQLQAKQIKSGAYQALEQQVAQVKSPLSRLRLAEHQHPSRCARRTERIATLSQELKQVQDQQAHTQKEVSRLEALIQQQMVRLDTRNKRLLDSLKLIARKAFYQALQPFKQAYHNYRDDHQLFRNLTQADGLLAETAEHGDAYLLPPVNYPPKLDRIVQRLLAELNATHPLMPDDSGRPLRLPLGDKSGFQVAIVS